MRSLGTAAAWVGSRVVAVQLVEMDFPSGMLYASTAPMDIDWGGHTYLGGRQVAIDAVNDQGGELQGLRFSLSGVPSELLALALAEPLQGRSVVLRLALLHPDTHAVAEVLPLWRGSMDQMPVRHGPESSVITVTAEHRGVQMARPKPLRYTDADQRRLQSGDRCLEYLVSQSQHPDVWPSAEYFKQ